MDQKDGNVSLDRRKLMTSLGAAMVAPALMTGPITVEGRTREAVVETTAGMVRGTYTDQVYAFAGVSYGASTAGANRFMPPQKPIPWAGVRDTPAMRVVAPQNNPKIPPPPPGSLFALIRESGALESEDCLSLNLWTPGLDGDKRPVMVWLHGGGYFSGSGSNPTYYGGKLAASGNVVVVNVTHRLNVLGYTYLGEVLGPQFVSSGNAGMLDIVAALEWVQQNVERFGGDASRVTLFGESGGGGKVASMLAMPRAHGLFHRAVMQSGSVRSFSEKPEATTATEILLAELGIPRARAIELQSVPLPRLMDAYFAASSKLGGILGSFGPVRDGASIPRHAFDPVANPLSADVPLLIGTNRTEVTLFQLGDEAAFNLDQRALTARMTATLGQNNGEAAVKLYREAYPSATPSDLYFLMLTDRSDFFRRGATQIAQMKAAAGRAPVFLYEMLWTTPIMDGRLRSPHGLEVSLVFANPQAPTTAPFTGGGTRALAMSKAMSSAWVQFATTGNPSTAAMPWPAYDLDQRTTMLFDATSRTAPDPFRSTRMFWDGVANAFV